MPLIDDWQELHLPTGGEQRKAQISRQYVFFYSVENFLHRRNRDCDESMSSEIDDFITIWCKSWFQNKWLVNVHEIHGSSAIIKEETCEYWIERNQFHRWWS
jgi:hypothetical protein